MSVSEELNINFYRPEDTIFKGMCHSLPRGVYIPACTWAEACRKRGGQGSMDRGVCGWGCGQCVCGGRHPSPDTMGYSQQTGGMHPTGMLSCLAESFTFLFFFEFALISLTF